MALHKPSVRRGASEDRGDGLNPPTPTTAGGGGGEALSLPLPAPQRTSSTSAGRLEKLRATDESRRPCRRLQALSAIS